MNEWLQWFIQRVMYNYLRRCTVHRCLWEEIFFPRRMNKLNVFIAFRTSDHTEKI